MSCSSLASGLRLHRYTSPARPLIRYGLHQASARGGPSKIASSNVLTACAFHVASPHHASLPS